MASGVVRMPGPEQEVARLLGLRYCVCCIKKRLQLKDASADEVDLVARQTPGALDGFCLDCKHERRSRLP